jgi:DNA-binding response OmpR family regulator
MQNEWIMAKSILVVDDDQLIRDSLNFNLQQAGYQVQMADCAEAALAIIHTVPPDLVLLDIGLPDMDGLETLRQIPESVPVIFVTGRRRELDEVLGLELGAQDYITKPFDTDVLLARIRAQLRRGRPLEPAPTTPALLRVGDIVVNPSSHSVDVAGRQVTLSPLEFRLLQTLAREAGKVLSGEKLLESVWGVQYMGEPQNLYVCIGELRAKIEEDPHRPRRLVTVRGVGYKLVAPEKE